MRMQNDSAYYRLAFKIFADLTGAIAAPAVLGALLGKWLDARYNTSPRYILLLLFLAFLCTAMMIVRKSTNYKEQYESISKNTKRDL